MIQPTIGRVVWFYPEGQDVDGQPLAAIVTRVHDDRTVNLGVFTADGHNYGRTSVTLVQEGDVPPPHDHARWMPYQVGQAKAHANVAQTASSQA